MKIRKILSVFTVLLLAFSLASCGSSSYDTAEDSSSGYYGYVEDDYGFESSSSAASGNSSSAPAGLKITYSADMRIETLDFENSFSSLQELISSEGGYISSEEKEGGYTSVYGYYEDCTATIECRIPAENLEDFLSASGNIGSVTNISQTQNDITSQYTDTEARLSSLNLQKEKLEELLAKADTVADMLDIEERLSDVIYEIESYTSQMNVYKDLVAYSTVTISLCEVEKITPSDDTFLDRLASAFSDSFDNVSSFFEGLLFFVIYAFPFAVIAAVVITVITVIVRKKKNKIRKNPEGQSKQA